MSLPARLKSARVLRGLSLKEMAARTGDDISLPTLSRYERGEVDPDAKKLRQIARALDLSYEYFLREPKEIGEVAYRKKKSLSAKLSDQIKEQTRDFLERFTQLEHVMNVSSEPFPRYEPKINSLEDVASAATWLRDKWKVGLSPIHSIVDELEAEHIKVLALKSHKSFDGLSSLPNGPEDFIVFNQNLPIDRQRFTLLHELGHHLLINVSDKLDHEKVVNRFAGEFAIPGEVMRERVGQKRKHIHPVELLELKGEFGLSVAALLYRAKDLHILTDHGFKNAMISISQLGWRKDEPAAFQGRENPSRMLELLGRGIAEDIISQSKAAELYGMKLGDFREVLFKGS
ncbi:hypothetical protein LEM8419_03455 [Neolewinella maritima]|uniref:HTH cro/C1-type domain-containing protein n=1 Tax=Neolewinella maritima TaxID=1383882 RepID=A0ABN8FE20_9BACT|nr:XRE family transcriptional regulator [Neolewinella maritima]CAH1002581.1 hypothetical protein LEM8419_03455 [Neolewinella maritima]